MYSLRARILATVSAVLLVCFVLTGLLLDLVFQRTAEQSIRERLDVQILALLSAAEMTPAGALRLPESLPEARFATPGSGLYGRITDARGRVLWRSQSSLGLDIPYPGPLPPGQRRLARVTASDDTPVFALGMGVEWELGGGDKREFTVAVAESLAPYRAQLARFRRQLFVWFGGALLLLVGVQVATLRWLMQPLRRAEREIADIEAGRRSELGAHYPAELAGLTRNLNALIGTERARLARYRESLGNLAHSLKTPLAVIRNTLETAPGAAVPPGEIREQLDRVDAIVGYQLRRAAMSGGTTLGSAPVALRAVADKVLASLHKIHAAKGVRATLEVDAEVRFHGDEGDLLEILGNLLDNAFQWCRSRVRVRARSLSRPGSRRPGFTLLVEDDGPGVAPAERARLWTRGGRSDESAGGHGIGLAVVRDLLELQDGTLELERSELGGAAFRVTIPPR